MQILVVLGVNVGEESLCSNADLQIQKLGVQETDVVMMVMF